MKSVRQAKSERFRPQRGAKLRELREARRLRQAEFADKVNAHMRALIPGLSATETLTQTMVSDLELGNADLCVLHLFAISDFFGVSPGDVLNDGLQSIGKSEINTCEPASLRACGIACWRIPISVSV